MDDNVENSNFVEVTDVDINRSLKISLTWYLMDNVWWKIYFVEVADVLFLDGSLILTMSNAGNLFQIH